jgi:hypothetical protein
MLIPLNLPPGERQQEFLDYLNSALRPRFNSFEGSAGYRSDERFESTVTGEFDLGTAKIPLTWRLLRSVDGQTLECLEVVASDVAPPESEWETAASQFVTGVLSAALAARRSSFFQRVMFSYIGVQLDGEYWLPGFRFAPIDPNDPDPALINAERVVVFDMNIEAVDHFHANALADEAARRNAARISLLLNVGLFRSDNTVKTWVLSPEGHFRSQRLQVGFFSPEATINAMPSKAEICPLGKYQGSLKALIRFAGTPMSLPPEARRILRGVDLAPTDVRLAFDRGARLHQVGAVIGRTFPSAGLAYRVAALDAISQAHGQKRVLTEFVRKYTREPSLADGVVDYLWGSIRSAHFHGGEFPLGEFSPARLMDPLMGVESTNQQNLQLFIYPLIREVIVRWIYDQLAGTVSHVENGMNPELTKEDL